MVRRAAPLVGLLALMLARACFAEDDLRLPPPRVAVFALPDPAELPDRMIGRRAADAVYDALAAESPWEPVDPGRLLRLCESEGVEPPLAVGYLQMLGQRASAPLAIGGRLEACEVNAGRGTAQVTLLVELVETLGGASLAQARGVASAKRETAEALDEAIDRALVEAAGNAARELGSLDVAEAVVVATLPDGRVLMDGPLEPRIRVGAKLLVFRGGAAQPEVIGALEVKSSKLTVLHARPLAGEGFFQGDRAVVVAR